MRRLFNRAWEGRTGIDSARRSFKVRRPDHRPRVSSPTKQRESKGELQADSTQPSGPRESMAAETLKFILA